MQPMIPVHRSRARREAGSTSARKMLLSYQQKILPADEDGEVSAAYRVQRLLWAEAEIQKLLALETRSAIGDPYATAAKVAHAHRELAAAKARALAAQAVDA